MLQNTKEFVMRNIMLPEDYFICDGISGVDDNRIVLGHYLLKSVELSLFHCTAKQAISLYPAKLPDPFLNGGAFNTSPLDL